MLQKSASQTFRDKSSDQHILEQSFLELSNSLSSIYQKTIESKRNPSSFRTFYEPQISKRLRVKSGLIKIKLNQDS